MGNISLLIGEWIYVIILVVAILFYAIFQWSDFKAKAYGLMLTARRLAQKKVIESGQAEETWVVNKLYIVLPKQITIFINEDNMHKIVHWLFVKAKDYSDDGEINGSVK